MHESSKEKCDWYGGYPYYRVGCGYRLLFDGNELCDFTNFKELEGFVDSCNAELNKHIGEWTLHLTGCKRCKRTIDGALFSPCGVGGALLMAAKSLAGSIARAAAKALKESRSVGKTKSVIRDTEQECAPQAVAVSSET